jgi:lipase chaperone LimK
MSGLTHASRRLSRRMLLLAAIALLVTAWSLLKQERVTPPARTPVFTDWNFNTFADGAPSEAIQHNADEALALDAARARVMKVFESGSLRGSDLDGDWGEWVADAAGAQQLQPSLSLRRRFDYLLTALGEVTAPDLRQWMAQEIGTELGSAAAQQVLAVWDRYVALQQASFKSQVNPNDAATWQPSLAERAAVRRQILGEEWAKAFYADEERDFVAFTGQLSTQRAAGTAVPGDAQMALLMPAAPTADAAQLQAQRVQQLGVEGAERLRGEEAQWADWERRLAAARMRLQEIAAAPELSALQRAQAQAAYLAQNFAGAELVRVRALLGVDR